ncbi:AAA family ATPase [Maridesulfovibrio ferrireducens]|uniref:AAA family ATPase n=1 Tax=Maridesulfovibrio ferrireducens TaxID=246191 RepID=UPI001A359350|nr:AAA family ATPase [Maridesulfovibrio ferrireducens]MBI9110306.1 AAA family ATPase [Maridesulfovibrio ferrireducens]
MKSIQIENLKSLVKTPKIEIKPITILVGKNSSGKSTFLRTFPLFKQSVEENIKAPILFCGNDVDFGDFSEIINKSTKNDSIIFTIESEIEQASLLNNAYRYTFNYSKFINRDDNEILPIKFISKIKNKVKNIRNTYLESFEISIADQNLNFKFNEDSKLIDLNINNESFKKFIDDIYSTNSGLVPNLITKMSIEKNYLFSLSTMFPQFQEQSRYERLLKIIKKHVYNTTSNENIADIVRSISIGSKSYTLSSCKNDFLKTKTWLKRAETWTTESKDFQSVNNALLFENFMSIVNFIGNHFKSYSQRINYISPFRASPERYYRHQELAVHNIDPQGKNTAIFLDNLTSSQKKKLEEWTDNNFNIKLKTTYKSGHLSIELKENESNFYINIADIGFGYSQLLPIIIQLWFKTTEDNKDISFNTGYETFAIEQPELHLHPKMIGHFTDLLVKLISSNRFKKSNIKLIIETHSKSFINRIGQHIAKKNITPDSVNVVIFDNKNGYESNIDIAKFNDKGMLKNWPANFFLPERF